MDEEFHCAGFLLVLVNFTVKCHLMLWNIDEYCRKAGFPQE